jgi:hypothetical protein
MFAHRLAEPLHDAAMHLPRDKQRIEDLPEIVHRREARDAIDAGIRVDLDLADMRPVRKRVALLRVFAIARELAETIWVTDSSRWWFEGESEAWWVKGKRRSDIRLTFSAPPC